MKTFVLLLTSVHVGRKIIIVDASVIIAQAKMRRLDLLNTVYGDILIGPQVKAETIDAGKRISAPGVERLEKAVDDGWLQIPTLIEGKEDGL